MTHAGYDAWKTYTPDQYEDPEDEQPTVACYGCGDPIPDGEGYLTDCETDDGEPTQELCCWRHRRLRCSPTGARHPRWAQADLREPEIDQHDESAYLTLRLVAGALGAGMMAYGLVALVAWSRGLL